jgi:predicted ester cyclase
MPAIWVSGIVIDRFLNGRIVEAWEHVDLFGLMQQLGSGQTSE